MCHLSPFHLGKTQCFTFCFLKLKKKPVLFLFYFLFVPWFILFGLDLMSFISYIFLFSISFPYENYSISWIHSLPSSSPFLSPSALFPFKPDMGSIPRSVLHILTRTRYLSYKNHVWFHWNRLKSYSIYLFKFGEVIWSRNWKDLQTKSLKYGYIYQKLSSLEFWV